MPSAHVRKRLRDSEPGFVLIGVVVFVLALTILGISLFGLSSFEAQFMTGSIDDSQAFYAASGGIDRARFALTATGRLESVQVNLPQWVDSTVAYQQQSSDTVTSGPVEWGGDDILIRAWAHEKGRTRVVEARFDPAINDDHYRRLFTVSRSVDVADMSGSRARTQLSGEIVLPVGADTSWSPGTPTADPTGLVPALQRPIIERAVPAPDLTTYFAQHWGAAQPVDETTIEANRAYLFTSNGAVPRYYSSAGSAANNFSVYFQGIGANPTFTVSGPVVWMLDKGFRSDTRVDIVPDPLRTDNVLIMVAKPGTDPGYPDNAIWFFAGLHSPSVPLFLVSDHAVWIEFFNNPAGFGYVGYLSVYAQDVRVLGPFDVSTSTIVQLVHPIGPDALVNQLTALDVLPGQAGFEGQDLSFIPNTWLSGGGSTP